MSYSHISEPGLCFLQGNIQHTEAQNKFKPTPWFAFATDAENQRGRKKKKNHMWRFPTAQLMHSHLLNPRNSKISSWQMNYSSAWAGRALAEHNGTPEHLVRVRQKIGPNYIMQEVRRTEQRGVGEKQRFPNRCVWGKKSSPGSNHRVSWIVFGLPLCAGSCRKSQQSRISRKAPGASGGNHKNNCSPSPPPAPGGSWGWNERVRVSKHCRAFPKASLWMEKPAHDRGKEGPSLNYSLFSRQLGWNRPQWLHLF